MNSCFLQSNHLLVQPTKYSRNKIKIMMQRDKKQAKNTSNNSDFSYSFLETRIKKARNTSNNDFSNSLLETRIKKARNTNNNSDFSNFFFSFLFFWYCSHFFRRYCSHFFISIFFSLLLFMIF